MRVLFLGNHTVGVKALDAISAGDEIVGVVAHPPDSEDGVRYLSVYDYAINCGWPSIRAKGKDPELLQFIKERAPDILWITDYRYLIPRDAILLAPLGVFNLHPSLLPRYRGRAPINWAIIKGEKRLGLTVHFVDEGTDTGDIIHQISYDLAQDQDVGDALNILYPLYYQVTRKVLDDFKKNKIVRVPQNHAEATIFPSRKPEDGLINWESPALIVWNLIRAIARPYPGAFSTLKGRKVLLWKAGSSNVPHDKKNLPGKVLLVEKGEFHVQCQDGPLFIKDYEFEEGRTQMEAGAILGG